MEFLYDKVVKCSIETDQTCQSCLIFKDYDYIQRFGISANVFQIDDTYMCLKDNSYVFCPRLGRKLPWAETLYKRYLLVDNEITDKN